jgi:hypothetical protein
MRCLTTFFRQPHIMLLCAYALGKAWRIKCGKRMALVSLDPTKQLRTLTELEIKQVLFWARTWVRVGAWCTGRKCFFQAYIAGRVLNHLGCPVRMNIGLKLDEGRRRVSGHCWLTLRGRSIGECDNPLNTYPISMAQSDKGVCYWMGVSMA